MIGLRKSLVVLLAFLTAVCTVWLSPVSVFAEDPTGLDAMPADSLVADDEPEQVLQLVVRTIADDQIFRIPTSSFYNGIYIGTPYDWEIDWGDGNTEVAQGQSNYNSGVRHYYATPGDYLVSVRPNGSTEAWLAAFGNTYVSSLFDATAQDLAMLPGDGLVIAVTSPLRPEMMRTAAQIAGIAPPPDYEWAYAFYDYQGLEQAPVFVGWDSISTVGNGFAAGMFTACYNLKTLPDGFNLPQNITEVGNMFGAYMFSYCWNLASLPDGFNLPQNITKSGTGFASNMFYQAGGPDFQINEGFMLPIGVSDEIGNSFARCFQLSETAPMQNRTAASIIGDCPTPTSPRQTFDYHFTDLDLIHVNWGGGYTPPTVGTPGTGDLDGDGFVTMDEVLTTARAALGDIGLSPEQLACIDMDGDGFITMFDVMQVYMMAIQ